SRNTVFPALDLLYYLSSECLAVSYTSRSLHRLLTPYVDNSSTFFEVSTYFRTRQMQDHMKEIQLIVFYEATAFGGGSSQFVACLGSGLSEVG
ncbi:MAG: hypothetical protein M1470_10705, partial [Bacteroidetes bacterium]|nr:hypothetical protein [Bacteroidota bacterium]